MHLTRCYLYEVLSLKFTPTSPLPPFKPSNEHSVPECTPPPRAYIYMLGCRMGGSMLHVSVASVFPCHMLNSRKGHVTCPYLLTPPLCCMSHVKFKKNAHVATLNLPVQAHDIHKHTYIAIPPFISAIGVLPKTNRVHAPTCSSKLNYRNSVNARKNNLKQLFKNARLIGASWRA